MDAASRREAMLKTLGCSGGGGSGGRVSGDRSSLLLSPVALIAVAVRAAEAVVVGVDA